MSKDYTIYIFFLGLFIQPFSFEIVRPMYGLTSED